MFKTRELYRTAEGHYVVSLVPTGYVVRSALSGAAIAWCGSEQLARAVADSREWADERDAEEERRGR